MSEPTDQELMRRHIQIMRQESAAHMNVDDEQEEIFRSMGIDGDSLLDILWSPYRSEDLTEALLLAYVRGDTLTEETEMVEAMMRIDSDLKETIEEIRAEMSPVVPVDAIVERLAPAKWRIADFLAKLSPRRFVLGAALAGATATLTLLVLNLLYREPPIANPNSPDTLWVVELEKQNKVLRDQHASDLSLLKKAKSGSQARSNQKALAFDVVEALLGTIVYPAVSNTRGDTDANFELLGSPQGTKVDPKTVQFNWKPPDGEQIVNYALELEALGRQKDRRSEPRLKAATHKTENNLLYDTTYKWYIVATPANASKGQVSSEGFFSTLSAGDATKAQEILKDRKKSPLAKAVLLGRLGCRDMARLQFNRVHWLDKNFEARLRMAILGE